MYPIAYAWMRNPTPVTTRIITVDKASTRRSAATLKSPTVIQSNSGRTKTRSSAASPRRPASARRAKTNEAPTVADPRMPAHLPKRLPKNRLITAPASGSAGTSQIRRSIASPFQEARFVDVRRMAAAEDRDDDRKADDHLGRSDHHREERQHLAVQVSELPRERHQREVHRVQLQLDRHEDHEGVAADQHSDRADREQDGGQDQEIGDRSPHGTGSSSGEARMRRRVSTIAAIAAMMSRIDVTSKGKK